MLVRIAAIVIALVVTSAPRHAAAHESGVRVGTRALATTYPGNSAYLDVLERFGYSRWLAVVWTVGGDHVWRASRLWDLGVHAAYATGRAGGDGGTFILHAPEAAFVARLVARDGRGPAPFGFQLEVGAIAPVLLLRGEAESSLEPYVRAELSVRPNSGPVSMDIRLGWTYARWDEAIGGTGMPLGGMSLAIGAVW